MTRNQTHAAPIRAAVKITCTPVGELSRPSFPTSASAPAAVLSASPPPPSPTTHLASSPLAAPLTHLLTSDRRVEAALQRALSGAPASPTQLLALQSDVLRHAQELELASRLVDKLAGAVKQTLQTQV